MMLALFVPMPWLTIAHGHASHGLKIFISVVLLCLAVTLISAALFPRH